MWWNGEKWTGHERNNPVAKRSPRTTVGDIVWGIVIGGLILTFLLWAIAENL